MLDNTCVATATTPSDANSLLVPAGSSVTGGESRALRRPGPPPGPKRELYAVAVEVLHKGSGRWQPDIRYTHAVDSPAAKYEVLRCIDWRRESCRIVGISRVIGYKVLDKEGLILAV